MAVSLSALQAQTELQKAVEDFRIQSRNLGLRSDGPAKPVSGAAAPQWHGRIYENFRNDFLDAVPHQIVQRGGDKSVLRRNQFGFNLTGPLTIPKIYSGGRKTYFSFSYEGVRDHVARSFLQTIPTTDERTGKFAAVVNQSGAFLPIHDPASTRPNPAFNASQPVTTGNLQHLRDPFPDNRIDPLRLDSVAANALTYYPPPNASVGPFFRNNYFIVDPETNNADGVILKIDHNAGERHRFSATLNHSDGFRGEAARLSTAADPGHPDRRYRTRSGALEHVFAVSPKTVNTIEFRASNERSSAGEEGMTDYAGKIGLRGSSPISFPAFSFSPYVSMGRDEPRSWDSDTDYQITNAFSTKPGKHLLEIVARHTRYQVHGFEAEYPAGRLRFGPGLTSLPGIVGTGSGFASFLLGLAEFAEKSYVVSPSYFRYYSTEVTLSEQYDPRPGLTFSLALRLSHSSPRVEKYDRQSTVDLSVVNPANGRPGAMIVAGRNGQGRAFQRHALRLDPGFGLAWSPAGDSNTVIRAEFQREHHFPEVDSSPWATQAFNAAPVYLSPNVFLEPALRLSDGLPPLGRPLPDTRPEALNDTNADLVYRGRLQPVSQEASLSLERRLGFSLLARVGVSAAAGRDLFVDEDAANLNAVHPDALAYRDKLNDEAFNRSLRPYPQYRSLRVGDLYPAGRFRREGAYVSLEKRASAGLSLAFRYDWTKQRDDYSGRGRQDFFNRRNEWSLSHDTPHRLTWTYIYELPFGPGKPLLAVSDWRRHILGGWSVSGSSTYSSGEPIELEPHFNNTGGVIEPLRVDVVPGVNPHVPDPGPDGWFNPAAFDQPPDFSLGNASRAHPTLRNPPSQNHDISVQKRVALGAGKVMEFNAVALNLLNHANWNEPDAVIGPASAPNVNAGKIIGSSGGRVIQLGLKVSF